MASIKENVEFYENPWALPMGFYWQNFVDAWQKASMGSVYAQLGDSHRPGPSRYS